MLHTAIGDSCSGDDSQNVSAELYEKEWTYLSNITGVDDLRNSAINGKLRTSRFRSICWRILLDVMDPDSSYWLSSIMYHRNVFEDLSLEYSNDREDSDLDEQISPYYICSWKLPPKEIKLKRIIEQDVVQTFPGVEFFKTEEIQKIMNKILFYYIMGHSALSYSQGMHEILALILFVLHCDHQALLHVQEQLSPDVRDKIIKILDPKHLEEDAYSLFSAIIEKIQYCDRGGYVMSAILLNQSETSYTSESDEDVPKLSKIRDTLLKLHDPELYEHLMNLDILSTTFGVRWLKLLFGGEFPLMDLLVLWDTIIAEPSEDFTIIDSIFVATLILLRVQLLESDNTNVLNYFMRPQNIDVMFVIKYALHLYDPETYTLPSVINSLNYNKNDKKKNSVLDNQQERTSKFTSNFLTRQTHNSSDELLELCRIKLLQYHSILNPVVPIHNEEAKRALSEMLELSGMLNSSQPGIIEMGKDIVQSTTPLQAPLMPEKPGELLLPFPDLEITNKVVHKTEN